MSILVLGLAILFSLITIKNLEHGVLVLIALLPTYLLRGTYLGIPTTLLELMLLIVVFVWVIQNRTRIISKFKLNKHWGIPILLLLVASTISIFIAEDTKAAIGIYKAYFIEPILFFFLLLDFLKQKNAKEKIFKSLGLSALVASLFGIYQWITNSGIPVPWDFENRITSVFDYPNALGLFLGPIIILGCLQIYKNHKDWFWIAVTTFSSIAIILAKSEAALVAVIATLIVFFVSNKKTRKITSAFLVAAAIIIVLIPSLRNPISQKLLLQDYSGQVRITIWTESIEMLKTRPIFGAGLSGFPSTLKPFHKAKHLELFQYPHNTFLNIWTELGLLGILAFCLLAFQILKKPQNTIALFVLLEMFIHGLVDVPYFKNDLAILTWIFLAILITQYDLSKNSKKYN